MASSRHSAHAHAPVAAAKLDEGARSTGHAGHATDFLTKKVGLGSHVLVALHRSLAPSQVGRVVAAWRAGAPLASRLEVRGRQPAELVRDPHFGWMAAVKNVAIVEEAHAAAAHAPTPAEHASAALVDKLAAAAVAEVTGSSPSARVLIEVVLVAQHNHVAPALCERLRHAPHRTFGNCFNALLSLTGSEGSAALEHGVEGSLGHAGVDVAPDAAIAKLGAHEKLVRAAKYGGADLLGETAKQLVGMLPALAVFWAASHLTVLGPTLDLLGIGMLGQQGVQAIEDLLAFRTMAEEARTEADLRAAGARFAAAIASIGIGGVLALVGWARGRRAKAAEYAKTETAPPESATHQQPAPRTPLEPAHEAAPHRPAEQQVAHGPIDEHAHAERSEHDAEKRVDEKVEGHAESVGGAAPAGWKIVDEHAEFDPITGQARAFTEVIDPNGETSYFERTFDPAKGTLKLVMAFLHKNAPRWVRHEGTMMKDKGTPTQSYWTMRQVKNLLRLAPKDVKSVKMSRVQNVTTVLQVEQAKRSGLDPATVLDDTASVRYAKTPLTQLGMHAVPGSVKMSGDPVRGPIADLMDRQEFRGYADRAKNDALLKTYGFTRTDVVEYDYDITFDVSATPSKAQK